LAATQGDPFRRFDEGRHAPDDGHPLVGLPFGEAELVAQDSFELSQNEGGEEKLHLASADTLKDLIRFTAREGEGGEQDVGVQDHAHGGLLPPGMDEPGHILLAPQAEDLGAGRRLTLELPPAALVDIHPQRLADQFALGPVLFLRDALGLPEQVGGGGTPSKSVSSASHDPP